MDIQLLQRNIERFISLNQDEIDFLISKVVIKKLRKRQYFLQAGEWCRYQGFVNKGCLRTYEIDEKGAEHVVLFTPEDWWVGDLYSFYTTEPSKLNVEAMEDCELFIFDKDSLEEIYTHIPKMERFFRLLMQNALIALSRRMMSSMTQTTLERYCDFIQRYPEIEQRVPNHQIAAYLGVKPESLSRIRKQYLQSDKKTS